MNKQENQQANACAKYEQQIRQMIEENNDLINFPGLKEHIAGCAGCAATVGLLDNLRDGLGKDLGRKSKVPAAILRNTLKYMEIKYSAKRKKETLWDHLTAGLQYRIPVYQAVGGLIVVLFLSGLLWNSRIIPGGSGMPVFSQGADVQDVYVLDSLQADQAGRGQNAREDSILVSFLQYSL